MALREDKERRRFEEAAIRRYPIDDLELLEEKLAKAEAEGLDLLHPFICSANWNVLPFTFAHP